MKFTAIYLKFANTHKTSLFSIELAFVDSNVIKKQTIEFEPKPNYFEHRNNFVYNLDNEDNTKSQYLKNENAELNMLDNEVITKSNFDKAIIISVLSDFGINTDKINFYSIRQFSKKTNKHLINHQLNTLYSTFVKTENSKNLNNAERLALTSIELLNKNKADNFAELFKKFNFDNTFLFENNQNHPFKNKRISFFGEMTTLTRKNAQRIVEKIGGITKPENLSTKTNFLIIGQNDYDEYLKNIPNKTKKIIDNNNDFEILSEKDFLEFIIFESSPHEVTLKQIEKDNLEFLSRNKYNDLSGKKVFFSSDLSIDRLQAFQLVGNCSGFGHDYDYDVVSETDYFVISSKTIELLKQGIKTKSILDFEQLKSKAQEKVDKQENDEIFEFAKKTFLLDEKTFLEYMDRRKKFQDGKIKMNIYEWEVGKQ